jgi:hypothetical protein
MHNVFMQLDGLTPFPGRVGRFSLTPEIQAPSSRAGRNVRFSLARKMR